MDAFTAYNCTNSSNVVKPYSLLEPDTSAASDGNGEIKTTVSGDIAQMKQDRIIPVFGCQVKETIVSQYHGTGHQHV